MNNSTLSGNAVGEGGSDNVTFGFLTGDVNGDRVVSNAYDIPR
jgi:hypothetical protein